MLNQTLKMNYQSELMNNYVTQKPIDTEKDLKALVACDGRPLIFSIGNDDRFNLIYQTSNESAPWKSVFLAKEKITSFAVGQDPQTGELRLAYATSEEGKAKLFYSKLRDNQQGSMQCAASFEWAEQSIEQDTVEINKIELNAEYMMYSTKSLSGEAFYFTARFGDKSTKYELPELGTMILDFKVGFYHEKMGAFLLYQVGKSQSLIFRAFASENDQTINLPTRFSIVEGMIFNSIALISGKNTHDSLVACGSHVFLYKSNKIKQELIAPRGSEFLGIQIAGSINSASIWVVEKTPDQQRRLLFLTNEFFDEDTQKIISKWTSDIPFARGIRNFACVKGAVSSNDLMLINDSNELIHTYQDSQSSLWREGTINLEDSGQCIEFACYTTRLILQDEADQSPMIEKASYVSSSSKIAAIINGVSFDLTKENPVLVKTDMMGTLTIITPVDEINTPLLYVGFDAETPRYILNPAHEVEERLSGIVDAKSFEEAVTDDGKKLWVGDDKPGKNDLNQAAKIIQELIATKRGMLEDELAQLPGADVDQFTGSVDGIWGANFDDDKVQFLNEEEVADLLKLNRQQSASNGFNPIKLVGQGFGALFKGLKSLFGKLRSFIVKTINKVTEFILDFGGKIFRFVIDTLEKIFPFLTVIFDTLKLVFQTVLHWIGRLLGWDDIWDTHKKIASMTKNSTESMAKNVALSVEGWKDSIHSQILNLEEELKNIADDQLPKDTEKKDSVGDSILSMFISPLSSWPMYQIMHSGMLKKIADLTLGSTPAFEDFINKQAEIYKYVGEFIEEQRGAIIRFIKNPRFSVKGLLALFEPLLTRVLKTVDSLIQELFDLLSSAIQEITSLINSEVEIPFLTPIYKFVTNLLGEKEEFTFLNGFSLLISIPFTLSYKIATGKKPFADVTSDNFGSVEMYDQFWQMGTLNSSSNENQLKTSNNQNNAVYEECVDAYQLYGGILAGVFGMVGIGFQAGEGKAAGTVVKVLSAVTAGFTLPVCRGDLSKVKNSVSYSFEWVQYLVGLTMSFALKPNDEKGKKVFSKGVAIVRIVLSVVCLGTNITSNVLAEKTGVLNWIGTMMNRASSVGVSAGNFPKANPEVLIPSAAIGFIGCGLLLSSAIVEADTDPSFGTFG